MVKLEASVRTLDREPPEVALLRERGCHGLRHVRKQYTIVDQFLDWVS